ncbi:NADP-dependent 3-hydroxy acid dehydrogenase YdfG [Kaistia soli DSM 19436]|uniref:NADP-dependent 3-hydroxy acid dehydrogenase YdfG n=1 Tax=Kaistia soli DSM 19436 TaxID=1122133 RepID=A0A1M5KMW8_9HYPH|nr:SDR family oxidoreductase [Kaistia soli]SHG54030.1 NADP-dependent 3-hydroxy acid dehydrogenase YdfG [Kaistia soli DSM 19436]
MNSLVGKVAWITGAGSGIGQAVATALADAGCTVVLTGRRQDALEQTAQTITRDGGKSVVRAGDLTDAETAELIVGEIEARFGRLDILINNAGGNIVDRAWKDLTSSSIDTLIASNLSAAFYCATAAMHPMRKAGQGQLIHIASWAGKFIHPVSGPAYTAAKHAVVAMSQSINMEEYRNGIRSTAILPAEVATPILDKRPTPPSSEERAEMLQPADLAALALFIATQPASVCLNEVVISPRLNKFYER